VVNYLALMQLCVVQKELDDIKKEVTARIYKEFEIKFGGNNRKFADAVGCNEKTIRLLFDHQQVCH
jgi:hypothetical protein